MNLSPKQIVKELDKYIIGQDEAKKSLKIASEICVFTNDNITCETL